MLEDRAIVRLDALTRDRNFHTADGEQGGLADIVHLALGDRACRLIDAVVDDLYFETPMERYHAGEIRLPTKVDFELGSDAGSVRHSRDVGIFDDAEDRILGIILNQGLQHPDRVRGATATRIVLCVRNDDGLCGTSGNPHGFFDGIVGRQKRFGEFGFLKRDQLRDLVDRGIGFFLAIGMGAYGRSAFAQVAWWKSREISERQHIV